MNAAILLVSSAWMAGQTPEVIIPVNHAHSASASCGSSCGSACCDSGPKLRDRIRGLFQRDRCDSCAQPRCHDACPKPRCEVACPKPRCEDTCREPRCHSFQLPQLNLNFGNRCKSSCDSRGHRAHHASCDSCERGDLFGRIRGMFQRDCNTGCNTGCCTAGGGATPSAEPLKEQPKKMPNPSSTPKKGGEEVRVITPPAQALPAIQNAPAIAPAIAPRIIENDARNPF